MEQEKSDQQNHQLGALFRKYGSDKDRNGYTALYKSLFKNIRNHKDLVILEIGVGCIQAMGASYAGYEGASLRVWGDYFPNARRVYGIDISPDIQRIKFDDNNTKLSVHLCNSVDTESVNKFIQLVRQELLNQNEEFLNQNEELLNQNEPLFDIIIDDGSHLQEHQVQTLAHFYKYLKPNGYYIIEDIGGDMRNLGYSRCPLFHPPRVAINSIIHNSDNYIVHDWSHDSAVLVITKD